MFEFMVKVSDFWSEPRSDGISQQFLVTVGVLMGILSSFINCVGFNLQKQSLCDPLNENISPYYQPKWVAGLWLVIIGSTMDFMGIGLAPQSLLAPLAALSLVFNLGMASYMLGETSTKQDLYATLTIFFGTGLALRNAPHEEVEYSLEDLMQLWEMDRMFYYAIVVPILLLIHYLLVFFTENPGHTLTPPFFNVNLSKSSSSSPLWRFKAIRFMRMAGYCGFAGVIGGQSLLFAKSIVELIKTAFKGSGVFWHIQPYMIIFMLCLCLYLQIQFLNGALKYFDSLYVIPVYQSYWIVAGVVGGLVYFGEWEKMTPMESRLFIIGILITFSGLFILTQKEPHGTSRRSSSVFMKDRESDGGIDETTSLKETAEYNGNTYQNVPTDISTDDRHRYSFA